MSKSKFTIIGTLVVFLLSCVGCSAPSNSIWVDARVMVGDFEFLDDFQNQPFENAIILSDIESFFLLQTKNWPNPSPRKLRISDSTTLTDTYEGKHPEYQIQLASRIDHNQIELVVTELSTSEFELESDELRISIPKGGSVIIRSKTSTTSGQKVWFWIMPNIVNNTERK